MSPEGNSNPPDEKGERTETDDDRNTTIGSPDYPKTREGWQELEQKEKERNRRFIDKRKCQEEPK